MCGSAPPVARSPSCRLTCRKQASWRPDQDVSEGAEGAIRGSTPHTAAFHRDRKDRSQKIDDPVTAYRFVLATTGPLIARLIGPSSTSPVSGREEEIV
jgi:hypothetical protein